MMCLVAFVDVSTMLPVPRDSVVRMTEDWNRDLAAPDVIRGRTTGTRDVPPRLITTGPEVDVRMIVSPGLPARLSLNTPPACKQFNIVINKHKQHNQTQWSLLRQKTMYIFSPWVSIRLGKHASDMHGHITGTDDLL